MHLNLFKDIYCFSENSLMSTKVIGTEFIFIL